MKPDWTRIRAAFESGETVPDIADRTGVPASTIYGRAKRGEWQRKSLTHGQYTQVAAREDRQETALKLIKQGATNKLAALAAGVTPETVSRWLADHPEFAASVATARSQFLVRQIRKLDESGDWKAAHALLKAAPETREDFGQDRSGPGRVEIVLNIDREPVTVIDS